MGEKMDTPIFPDEFAKKWPSAYTGLAGSFCRGWVGNDDLLFGLETCRMAKSLLAGEKPKNTTATEAAQALINLLAITEEEVDATMAWLGEWAQIEESDRFEAFEAYSRETGWGAEKEEDDAEE